MGTEGTGDRVISTLGTEVVLSNVGDRLDRFCVCRLCRVIARCTLENFFYQLTSDKRGDGVLCKRCFHEVTKPWGQPK